MAILEAAQSLQDMLKSLLIYFISHFIAQNDVDFFLDIIVNADIDQILILNTSPADFFSCSKILHSGRTELGVIKTEF